MNFFNKIRHIKKKTILVILMPLVFIFVSFIVFINLNTLFQEEGATDVLAVENNDISETDEDNNGLSLEQKSIDNMEMDARKRDLDKRYEEIKQRAKELDELKKALEELEDFRGYDLLYRYEPYYILEGWNYVEEKRHQNTQTITDTF